MFEREIKFIYDFNLNRVKKIGSFVSYGQLIQADLHPAILQYISAEIDFLIFEDRQKLLKNSVFDYSGEKISKLFSQIDEEIKLNKKFSVEYINKLLLHSTSFIVNYLMRPRWTMIKFLFNDEEDKSAAEIKQVLKYLYFYGYLKDTLISYLDKKRIVTIKKNELEDLILKIDTLSMDSYLSAILEEAVRSMAGFFNIGTVQTNKVSLLAVKIFLKEKELQNHLEKLNEVYGEDNKQKVEIDELLLALKGVDYEPSESFSINLPTEQIEEDALETNDIPEFETVEEPDKDFLEEPGGSDDNLTEEETSAAETFPAAEEEEPQPIESGSKLPVGESLQDEIAGIAEEESPEENEIIGEEEENEEVEPPENNEDIFEEEEDNLLLKEVDERTKEEEPPFQELFKDESQTLVVERADEISEEKNPEDENPAEPSFDKEQETPSLEISEEITSETEEITTDDGEEETAASIEEISESAESTFLTSETTDDEMIEESSESFEETEAGSDQPFEENIFESETEEEPPSKGLSVEESASDFSGEEFTETVEESGAEKLFEEPEVEGKSTLDDFEEVTDSDDEINLEGFDDIIRESPEKITPPDEYFSIREEDEENFEHRDKDATKTDRLETETDEVFSSSPSEVIKEMESDLGLGEKPESDARKSDEEILEELPTQPQLFDDAAIGESKMETGFSAEETDETPAAETEQKEKTYTKIDISELLHNKNMSRILKVVFDHDMQDFADTIEQISDCGSLEHAEEILDTLFKANQIKPTSKEAVAFKEIIQEYFDRK